MSCWRSCRSYRISCEVKIVYYWCFPFLQLISVKTKLSSGNFYRVHLLNSDWIAIWFVFIFRQVEKNTCERHWCFLVTENVQSRWIMSVRGRWCSLFLTEGSDLLYSNPGLKAAIHLILCRKLRRVKRRKCWCQSMNQYLLRLHQYMHFMVTVPVKKQVFQFISHWPLCLSVIECFPDFRVSGLNIRGPSSSSPFLGQGSK